MKFSISREDLLTPLQAVNNVVERRQTLPILANVMLVADQGELILTGTDMEVELVSTVPAAIETGGSITLPARKMMDIVKALPSGATCSMALSGEKFQLRSGKSKFLLATLSVNEFPTLSNQEAEYEVSLKADSLAALIDSTQFAMAHQDVRYYLNGLLLDAEGSVIRAVATDGHRLAYHEAPLLSELDAKHQFILPRKGVHEIRRVLADSTEPVVLKASAGQVRLEFGNQRVTSKLIDGNFPDYERVIPKGSKFAALGDRVTLKDGLSRASVLSNEKFRGIRICFEKDLMRAEAHNPEHEEAQEEIEIDYQGDTVEIGFNVGYLIDALNVLDTETVKIRFSDADSSCLITAEDDDSAKYVVMPMRL